MHYKILFFIVLIFFGTKVFAQDTLFENEILKFWREDSKLVAKDFKSDTTTDFNIVSNKYGMKSYSYCILKSILDVPKTKKDRKKKIEQVFFAPCIDKSKSILISTDSMELAKQQILFDITELFARKARRDLKKIYDSISFGKKTYGIYWFWFATIKSNICQQRNKLSDSYTREVILNKKEGGYEKWRKTIDELLLETKDFRTKPEDCLRFLLQKPLTDDYIESPDYYGEFKCH
ncbi:MAG: hypothetical protein RJA07_2042 [Bacteroidota bacterium]|jgi:hypothetical protein